MSKNNLKDKNEPNSLICTIAAPIVLNTVFFLVLWLYYVSTGSRGCDLCMSRAQVASAYRKLWLIYTVVAILLFQIPFWIMKSVMKKKQKGPVFSNIVTILVCSAFYIAAVAIFYFVNK